MTVKPAGLFITFEGGDGTGKSTQSKLLAESFIAADRAVVLTREPGGTELGQRIRDLVLHHRGAVDDRAEALLYAADRAQHIAEIVRPALERGDVVIQDRYFDSSVAYQGAGRNMDPADIRQLSMWASRNLVPDLTVLLDLDEMVARERLNAANKEPDRLESEKAEFHAKVRRAFLEIAASEPDRFLVLDATLPVSELAAQIRERAVSTAR